MTSLKEELEEVKTKYKALREEWGLQQEHLGRQQNDVFRLRRQLQEQSAFCASLGSTLGHLLWKASRTPQIVEALITGNKMGDFLCIVTGTLSSFIETYKTEIPGQSSDESQFVMSLVGIVTNIAAASDGRSFLMTDDIGNNLIENFIKTLKDIPIPSGNCLKRDRRIYGFHKDQSIPTRAHRKQILGEDVSELCRQCQKTSETADHILGGYSVLESHFYLYRHNRVAKLLNQQIGTRCCLLKDPPPYYKYNPLPVADNQNFMLYWDKAVRTDKSVDYKFMVLSDLLIYIPITVLPCTRLIFMSLYNISINHRGVIYLQGQPDLIVAIGETLTDGTHSRELQTMALRLLQSLTWDITCSATLDQIQEAVPRSVLENFAYSNDGDEAREAGRVILINIQKSREKITQRNERKESF